MIASAINQSTANDLKASYFLTRFASQFRTRLASSRQDFFSTLPLIVSPLIWPWNIECVTLFVSTG